ncbi:phosphonate transport system substrate-binding protein [Brevibacterium pityocampae]
MLSSTTRALRTGSAALSALALMALAACGQSAASETAEGGSDGDAIVFASIPSEESSSVAEDFAVILEVIKGETGREVEVQNANSYAAVIEAQRAGQVDIAGYGPFSYVTAKDTGVPVEAVGVAIEAEGAEPGYQSYGIAPADSDIEGIEDFAGKKVCFVDPTSTSGYLYPTAGLMEADIDPANDLEEVMAGGHDASALSVADGTCDAGFAYDTMVTNELIESGQLEEGALKVVWESETIAGSPVAIREDIDPELAEQLRDIFQTKLTLPWLVENGYCDDEESCQLPEDSWGYIPVEDNLYDGVREVCSVTEAEACQN